MSETIGSTGYYEQLAVEDAQEYGVPPQLFLDQIQQESGFNPNPTTGVPGGGIAQFIGTTAQEFGLTNPASNPVQSLADAAEYDAQLYQSNGDSWANALQAYGTTANGDAPALAQEAAYYDANPTLTTGVAPTTPSTTAASTNSSGPLAAIANFFENIDSYIIDAVIVVLGIVLVGGGIMMLSKSDLPKVLPV